MDKKPSEIHENLIPMKINNHTIQQYSYTTNNTPYNWPASLAASCLNIGFTSSYALIRICN